MANEIKVPVLPESITEGTVASWYKKPGESVKRDEHLVDIETDKVVLEVVAPGDGVLEKILKEAGSTVKSGEIIGIFQEGAGKTDKKTAPAETEKPAQKMVGVAQQAQAVTKSTPLLSPGARQLSSEYDIDTAGIEGTGKGGRVTRADIMQAKTSAPEKKKESVTEKTEKVTQAKPKTEEETATKQSEESMEEGGRIERHVPMTRLRARIAERLLAAKQNTALLTTFNEINMQPVMSIRNKYKEQFEKTHGVRLGLMSFFTVAVVEALKQFPIINASVDGNDIVYHGYYDIGIAVSTPRGLVVPILRNAESMTMPDIERKIAEYGEKAQSGHLSMEDITGGTFTISNGGVFGSLMSTPILNPPQSAILGMHKILERPIAEAGQVVIRPMMYVALSYDHRIIDGADSVRFLLHVKELIEDPARIALGI